VYNTPRAIRRQEVYVLTREALGERIAQERKRAGLTQEQLAAALGLERTAVTRIEQGSQGLETLQLSAIADALGRPPMVFFEPEDQSLELLLHAPEARGSEVRHWLQWLDGFVRDYEFLRSLPAVERA
jgi:transcriptional regulator with XRE-family HTH domain